MRGLFIVARGALDIRDMPDPRPGPFEALVRVRACGICNSTDAKLIANEFCPGPFPALLGHESVGEVIELGSGVENYRVGDLVLRPGLNDEQVKPAGVRSVWGGFAELGLVRDVWAERGVAPEDAFHPQQVVPRGVDPALAAAMITLKETLSCLRSTGVGAGQSLGIVGTGPVAEALAFFAHLEGIAPVVVFGRSPVHAERLLRAGADAYVLPGELPPYDLLDRVIEAVGSREALRRALEVCKPDGRINVYGVAPASAPYDPADMADGRVYVGKVAEAEEHERLLGMMDSGRVRLEEWVDSVLPWEEYAEGFAVIKSRSARKVVLTIGES